MKLPSITQGVNLVVWILIGNSQGYVDISMPHYITTELEKLNHRSPNQPQNA